ncbi:MAG: hypothetical protein ACI93R_003026 [Flavobacteriales bacterium]|jgi:hypothetical protein
MLKRIFFTKNVGTLDRFLRSLPLAVVAVLWLTGTITGTLLVFLAVMAGLTALTSVTGTCSIYGMCGISSLRKS